MVWIGKNASSREKQNALCYAQVSEGIDSINQIGRIKTSSTILL